MKFAILAAAMVNGTLYFLTTEGVVPCTDEVLSKIYAALFGAGGAQ